MRIPAIGATLGLCLTIALPAISTAETVADLLPAADIAKGEKAFKKCKACHTAEKGGKKNRPQPLWHRRRACRRR
ncbi:MAG: hypothetical protein VX228_06340 [Pseudomonadota bacterium]|nr:hypothetical protein [Pseudomonadota bacterium]